VTVRAAAKLWLAEKSRLKTPPGTFEMSIVAEVAETKVAGGLKIKVLLTVEVR
jgi:hypothetical protein